VVARDAIAAEEAVAAAAAGDPAVGLELDLDLDAGGELCRAHEARPPFAAGKVDAHGQAGRADRQHQAKQRHFILVTRVAEGPVSLARSISAGARAPH